MLLLTFATLEHLINLSGDAAKTRMSFPYPCSGVLKSRVLYALVLMKPPTADGAAICLLSPEHANRRRQFLDWVPTRPPALMILQAQGAGRRCWCEGLEGGGLLPDRRLSA